MGSQSPRLTLATCLIAVIILPVSQAFSVLGVWNNIKHLFPFEVSAQEDSTVEPSLGDKFGILWGMPDSEAIIGYHFHQAIPLNALKGDILQYDFNINEAGSTSLPKWLYFNGSSNTFYGLPEPTDQGIVYIEINAALREKKNKMEPVTMSFFIRVHMPNRLHRQISNGKNLNQELDGTYTERLKPLQCAWDEATNVATLVLDTVMSKVAAQDRIKLLNKAAQFLGHSVKSLSLMPKRNSVVAKLLDQQILVAGPGNAEFATTNKGIELSWPVGCGEFKQANDISQVMEHNIKNNLITNELGYKIIGWHVSQTQLPENIRKQRNRRQALAATPTPTVYSSLPTRVTDVSPITQTASDTSPSMTMTQSVLVSSDVTPAPPVDSTTFIQETASSTVSSSLAVEPTAATTSSEIRTSIRETPSFSTSMQPSLSDFSSAFSESPGTSGVVSQLSGTILPSPTLSSMDSTTYSSSPLYTGMPPDSVLTEYLTVTPSFSLESEISSSMSSVEPSMTQIESSMAHATLFHSDLSFSTMSTPDLYESSLSSSFDIDSSIPVSFSSSVISSEEPHITPSLSTSYETSIMPTSVISSAMESYTVQPTTGLASSVTPSESETTFATMTASTERTSPVLSTSVGVEQTTNILPTASRISTDIFASVLPSTSVIDISTPSTLEPSESSISTLIIPSTFLPTPTLPTVSSIVSTQSLSSSLSVAETDLLSPSADIPSAAVSSMSSDFSSAVMSSSSIPDTTLTIIPTTLSVITSSSLPFSSSIATSIIIDASVTIMSSLGPTTFLTSSMLTSSEPSTSILSSTPLSSTTTSTRLYSTGEIIGVETFTALPPSSTVSPSPSVTSLYTMVSSDSLTSSSVATTISSVMSSSETISTTSIITTAYSSSSMTSSILPTSSSVVVTSIMPSSSTSPALTTLLPPITTSLVVTTESMTTAKLTTPKIVPTTEQLTTGEITTVAPNTAPLIMNPIDKIQSCLGTYFELKIPKDTFYDKEDGNTRNLNLSMYLANGSSLLLNSWVQFSAQTQTVYGLPLAKDVTQLPLEVYIVAEDSGGLKTRDAVQILIDINSVKDISYQFIMHFAEDFSNFMLATRNYMDVVSKLGAYYGDPNSTFTSITDIHSGSVVMSLTNNTISKVVCENETILDLYKKMNTSGQLNLAFVRAMVPHAVEQVELEWMGVCLLEPSNTTAEPTEGAIIAGGGTNVGVIIAVILVILIIIIIIIILLCIYCRRSKQKGSYLPEDEKPIFGRNRKPVLLEDELELKDKQNRPKRPIVLSKDTDPYTYSNEGYTPGEDGPRQRPPAYIVPYDGGYGPSFEAVDGPSTPALYLPSPAAASSPFDQPPPEYKLPPPYMMYPGQSHA